MGECVSRDECMCQERDKYPATPRPIPLMLPLPLLLPPLILGREHLLSRSLTKWYDDGLGAPDGRSPHTQDFDLSSSPRPSDHIPKFPSPLVGQVPRLDFTRLRAPCSSKNKLKSSATSEQKQLEHPSDETPMADYWTVRIKEVATANELEKMLGEPLDGSCLQELDGRKLRILENGHFPKARLSEAEIKSWHAACKVNKAYGSLNWCDETCPHLGTRGLDLHWTTRSDGCRYEYWSSNPGSKTYGVLVRVDGQTMTGIALGSDDGLAIVDGFVDQFRDDDVVQHLLHSGWPHFR